MVRRCFLTGACSVRIATTIFISSYILPLALISSYPSNKSRDNFIHISHAIRFCCAALYDICSTVSLASTRTLQTAQSVLNRFLGLSLILRENTETR
jgi:hypothetical protein